MTTAIWRSITLTAAALVAGGCATDASSRVAIEPARERPAAQTRADSAACSAASASMPPETARERDYAACLLARGHRVRMPFRVGNEHARLTIATEGKARAASAIAADLAGCQEMVQARRPGAADVVAGQLGGIRAGDPAQVRPHAVESVALADELRSCLVPRGYEARR
ncbi:MAG TPA: hypothetical protein VIE36_09485 [Methylomirabilota bacterium]|jgi:hypothetical protein